MRHGVFKYYQTPNLGDEIQSIAAARLLPRVDDYVEREEMHEFRSTEGVFLMANGWYIHNARAFPPSPCIEPFYISVHFSRDDLFSLEGISHLKAHGPIGCRDPHTKRAMVRHGIDAYLSGCLTLTLESSDDSDRTSNVYVVDVDRALLPRIPSEIAQRATRLTHYPTQRTRAAKFSEAEALLRLYAKAGLVITSRVHCALPCVAMQTPVVFLYPDRNDARVGALVPFLPVYTGSSMEIDWNPRPPDVSRHACRLREICRAAIELQQNPVQRSAYCRRLAEKLEQPWDRGPNR